MVAYSPAADASGRSAAVPIDVSSPSGGNSFGGLGRSSMTIKQPEKKVKGAPKLDENVQNQRVLTELESYLHERWQDAKFAKLDIERRMISSLRQRNGDYEPDQLAEISAIGGIPIYMMITKKICKACQSWLADIYNSAGDKPWSIEHTPIPDMPDDVIQGIRKQVIVDMYRLAYERGGNVPQGTDMAALAFLHGNRLRKMEEERVENEAKQRGERMEKKIEDQFADAKMNELIISFLQDLSVFPNAFIKGPFIRRRKVNTWGINGNRWVPQESWGMVLEYSVPSPFDMFVTADSNNTQDGTLFERMRLHPKNISAMVGVPGFSEERIKEVLQRMADGESMMWTTDTTIEQRRAEQENRRVTWMAKKGCADVLETHDNISGHMLRKWGVTGNYDDYEEYPIVAWKIFDRIVGVRLNHYPLGVRPYSTSSYETVPGSFWGSGIPESIKDVQSMCNNMARAIAFNANMAAGPQTAIDLNQLDPDEDPTDMRPWKVWFLRKSETGRDTNLPIQWFAPPVIVDKLMAIYDRFLREADDQSGIPPYFYGNESAAGAGKTLGGFQMLQENATRGIGLVATNVDTAVRETVTRQYVHNMIFDEDESIKGDLRVVTHGVRALMLKQRQQQVREMFRQSTANPVDAPIIGTEGRRKMLEMGANDAGYPDGSVVPTEEELKERMAREAEAQARAQAMQPATAPGQKPKPQTAPATVPQGAA